MKTVFRWPWRRAVIATMLFSLFACVACGAAAYAIPITTAAPGSARIEAEICVGMVSHARTLGSSQSQVQVGLWWQLTSMSILLPASVSPTTACTTIPWSSLWSPVGKIAFPP